MDTHTIALALMCSVTDTHNTGKQVSHRSHLIIANIHHLAPLHCRLSLFKFRSIVAGFFYHLLVGFKECLALCFTDQAALLPPTHDAHIPLDNETYNEHVEMLQASIRNVLAASESAATDLPDLGTIFISQLRSAAGLGSYINAVFPGSSKCMGMIRDIPTVLTQLIAKVRKTADSFTKFGHCLLDFHRGVRDFGWGTLVMSANLEQLMFRLEDSICILGRIIFYLSGPNESRSGMWLKLYKKPPPDDVPWPLLGDEDPCKTQDNGDYFLAPFHVGKLAEQKEKKLGTSPK